MISDVNDLLKFLQESESFSLEILIKDKDNVPKKKCLEIKSKVILDLIQDVLEYRSIKTKNYDSNKETEDIVETTISSFYNIIPSIDDFVKEK